VPRESDSDRLRHSRTGSSKTADNSVSFARGEVRFSQVSTVHSPAGLLSLGLGFESYPRSDRHERGRSRRRHLAGRAPLSRRSEHSHSHEAGAD